ncbi:cadmium transporter [Terrihabitans soli]|uniref:Protein p34 n=1 Tax=Terrihabitans soli TaxID=708113 RepID=A0A6S6QGA5_9HYPH|nr:cation diffusion facilitator family transporter [Terrihabitans soli]BCJ90163.1 cadmium transporter [Terrihabitans soli]
MSAHKLFRLALGSILVSLIVLGLKVLAYWLTGSVALYSDALESVINVVTAITAAAALWFSHQPADHNHPYGHGKAEYLSAVLVGVLITLAAISIARYAYYGFLDPKPMNAPFEGLAVNLAATVINVVWAFVLIRTGRRERSLALEADGKHIFTDVITSVGVFFGLVGAVVFDLPILDPIFAALVALNIVWMGVMLMRQSVGGLMDEAVASDTLAEIKAIISKEAEGAIEAHDIRTRQAGRNIFVEFHLVVPGTMSVSDAHDICDRIERAVEDGVEGTAVTIHVEPDNKAKHQGIVVI